jgi:hypothetical protein
MPLPDFLANFTRTPRTRRASMDERLPDGRTVAEAATGVQPERNMMMRTGEPAAGEPLAVDASPDDGPMTRPRVVARPVEQARNRQAEMRAGLPVESDPTLPPSEVSRMPQEAVPAREVTAATTTTPPPPQPAPAREPWMERLRSEQDRLAALEADENPRDKNGRLVSTLMGVARGFSRGGLMGAAAEGIRSGIAPNADERLTRDARKVRTTARIGQLNTLRKADAEYDQTLAQTRQINANARYAEEFKPREVEQKALTRERTLIKANLSTLKGQKLDPANPRHAAFLERAERAGYFIDPDEWNNAAGNLVSVTEVDPENPTQTRQKFYNKATGELSDVGQKGYVQPVGANGMTTAQERADADRDASRADTNARFEKMFGLGIERFQESVRRGLSADAARTFSVEVRGQFERVRAIEKEIADLERRKSENLIRASEANPRIDALRGEATQLGEEVEAARSKALGASSAAGRPAPAARRPAAAAASRRPAAAPPSSPAPAVDEGAIRAKAIEMGLDPDTAVQRARSRRMLK